MQLSQVQPLRKSGLYLPGNLKEGDYTRKSRVIWTPDGEVSIPRRKRKAKRGLTGSVRQVWAKDETGKLILFDPIGEANTISDGALYDILQFFAGYWSNSQGVSFGSSYTGSAGPAVFGPWYNDGTYIFPNINDLNSLYDGTNTYYADASLTQLAWTLFGNLWFLNGVSGGMTGSHIPSAGLGAGFYPSSADSYQYYFADGWISESQSQSLSPNTTISDSVSNATSGTPQIAHTLTLSLSSSGTGFTFDGIAWLPQNAFYRQNQGNSGGSFYSAGATPSLIGNAYGSYPVVTATWGSASTTPSTLDDLMVAALWVPGYAVTLNPGGSWGFTYTFQM